MTHEELPQGYEPTNVVEVIVGAGRKYENFRICGESTGNKPSDREGA